MGCGFDFDFGKKRHKQDNHRSGTEGPIEVLKNRLAKGEISFEEYEKTKALLGK